MQKKYMLFILVVSIVSFYIGFYTADKETEELRKSYANFLEITNDNKALETKLYLDVLVSLESGDSSFAKDFLITNIKKYLKNEFLHNRFSKKGGIYDKAISYQEKYCDADCLGIKPEKL